MNTDSNLVVVLVVLLVAAAVGAVFWLTRKKPEQLPPEEAPKPLPGKEKPRAKSERPPKPEAKPEAKAKPEKPAKQAEPKPEPKPIEPEVAKAPEPRVETPRRDIPAPLPTPKKDVEGLRKGLTKARGKEGFFGRLRSLFAGKKELDPALVEQMEEVLLGSDVGVKTTQMLLEDLRGRIEKHEVEDGERAWAALRASATRILSTGKGGLSLPAKPTVVMVVGVNGVGKTTTIGKLATKLKADDRKVVLAAGDTFRAAAVQQLAIWGKRVGCEVVSGKDGANPGSVIFDAIQRAKEIGADVVLADTAGRLHTKTNLMEELARVAKTMGKAMDGAPHETLLVLDATNGQNAMQQAALFKEALPLSGIVLTKLDGTAKGGVILGICAEHGLPVRYIGIGERAEDLREFDAEEFVEAMLGGSGDSSSAAA